MWKVGGVVWWWFRNRKCKMQKERAKASEERVTKANSECCEAFEA